MSTDAFSRLAYGIYVKDSEELLNWGEETDEHWWMSINNFVNPCPNPFNKKGNWATTSKLRRQQMYDAWYGAERDWLREHPLPFLRINVCSDEYPVYMLAVPGTERSANIEEPLLILKDSLVVGDGVLSAFNQFIKKYLSQLDKEQRGWYLSSCVSY